MSNEKSVRRLRRDLTKATAKVITSTTFNLWSVISNNGKQGGRNENHH